jgi:hypothetical protein
MRLVVALGSMVLAVASAPAMLADSISIQAGDYIRLTNGPGDSPGGEFIANKQTWDGSNWVDTSTAWSTFCLETNESFSYGQLLKVASIGDAAVNGGSGGPSPDPVSDKTAWLYTQLQTGNLVGLNAGGTAASGSYLGSQAANATHLQKAIWFLEDETLGVNNYYVTLATNAVNAGWTNSAGYVKVLNLEKWNSTTGTWVKSQDQLVYAVPEPASIALFAAGLAAFGAAKRRSRARARAA